MRASPFHAWLLALSDPEGRRAMPLRPLAAARGPVLCEVADYHGVLPAVVANARRASATMEEVLAGAKGRLIGRAGLSLMIRSQIRGIAVEFKAAGVPVAVLKGADFADHLYPDPSLRPFTDLDLIVPERAVPEA